MLQVVVDPATIIAGLWEEKPCRNRPTQAFNIDLHLIACRRCEVGDGMISFSLMHGFLETLMSTLKNHLPTALALVAAALLAGCAADPTDRAPTAAYRCEDGSRFTVRFDPNSASVHLANGRTITLPQQKAASGMWYSGKGHDLRGKGDDATWTADGAPATACRSV